MFCTRRRTIPIDGRCPARDTRYTEYSMYCAAQRQRQCKRTHDARHYHSRRALLTAILLYLMPTSQESLAAAAAASSSHTSTLQPPPPPSPATTSPPDRISNTETAMLSRVEASIFAESALVDKETGRIFWEGGGTSTLQASVLRPTLQSWGVRHVKASFLSALLWFCILGRVSSVLERRMSSRVFDWSDDEERVVPRVVTRCITAVLTLLRWMAYRFPRFSPVLIGALISLYVLEAYLSNTRAYLSNCVTDANLPAYMDLLRTTPANVTWTTRSFHYEDQMAWLSPRAWGQALRHMLQQQKRDDSNNLDGGAADEDDAVVVARNNKTATTQPPSPKKQKSLFRRKVVTNQATGMYQYRTCVDKTIAGVWRKALVAQDDGGLLLPKRRHPYGAPFAKLSLSKIIVLANRKARDDYFTQQSTFFAASRDEYTEFSTNIDVPGFTNRVLVVRQPRRDGTQHHPGRPMWDAVQQLLFRSPLWFWLFTVLGLTVPYRWWFAAHCDELRVLVLKECYADNNVGGGSGTGKSWFSLGRNNGDDDEHQEQFLNIMQTFQLYNNAPAESESAQVTRQGVTTDDSLNGQGPAPVPNEQKSQDKLDKQRCSADEKEVQQAVESAKALQDETPNADYPDALQQQQKAPGDTDTTRGDVAHDDTDQQADNDS